MGGGWRLGRVSGLIALEARLVATPEARWMTGRWTFWAEIPLTWREDAAR